MHSHQNLARRRNDRRSPSAPAQKPSRVDSWLEFVITPELRTLSFGELVLHVGVLATDHISYSRPEDDSAALIAEQRFHACAINRHSEQAKSEHERRRRFRHA